MEELDKDTSLLARSAANHLTLSQLEPLRATVLSLRHRNPDLARSFLQTSIANASIFPNSSLLAYLSLLDLLRFPDAADIWPFSVQVLRLRVEFALCVDQIASSVRESGSDDVRVSRGVESSVEESDLADGDELRDSGSVDVVDGIASRVSWSGSEGLESSVKGSDSAVVDELRDSGSDAVVEEIAFRVSRGLDSSVEESGLGSDSAVVDDSSDLPDSGLKIGITTEDVASSISDLTVISKLPESGSGAVIEEENISSWVSKLPVLNRSKQDSGSESGQVLEERDSRFSGLEVLEKLSESSSGAVTEKEDLDSRVSKLPILNRSKQDSGSNSGLVLEERDSRFSGLKVLEKLSELALNRLRPDDSGVVLIEEEEIYSIKGLVLENAELFDVLCANVQKQIKGDEAEGGEGMRVLRLVQKMVQVAHLNAISACLDAFDVDRALSHVRFLHLEWGVEDSEYRMVLQDLLKRLLVRKGNYGKTWFSMRERLLSIYREALSSGCNHLVQMIQVIHDELLLKEIEVFRNSDNNHLPLPLEHLWSFLMNMKPETSPDERNSSLKKASSSCMRDMYHYARVSGLHVLECVMDAALSAVKGEQLQEASTILSLFPRLQPLVAAMGWDLLSGKTTARRKLMQVLWTSKSQVLRLEESSLYGNHLDEVSSVEHLCDFLCYQLDIASFVACVNSGQSWSSKSSILLSRKEPYTIDDYHSDPFVENFVLERLSVQGPLRVLFDLVPSIKFQDAIELISMQPITSTIAAWKRMEDIELMHLRYALEFAVLALGTMERTDETGSLNLLALCFLKDMQSHLEAISSFPRKILMVNIVISLLHMDELAVNVSQCLAAGCNYESSDVDHAESFEGGNKMVVSFVGQLLDILRQHLPSTACEPNSFQSGSVPSEGIQVLDWRIMIARRFIEDWEWRLSILQQLLPLSERQWGWKEALTVLRAAPSKLLNLCMQRAKYEIGEEAVHRFRLPPEDKVTLEFAEWVDGTFRRTSVEDAVSRAADGTTSVQDIDFSSLRAQLGPLAAILLCIDVATSSAKSASMSQKLLDQAQIMLSEIYPGGAPRTGSTYWDQIHEVGIISVARRVLKRLHELLEQDKPPVLQDMLSGDVVGLSPKELSQQHRERALAMLQQMIEDAHMGKRQFLSGKLHNVARAIADEEMEKDYVKGEGSHCQRKLVTSDMEGLLGLGLRARKHIFVSSTAPENDFQQIDAIDPGKRMFGPLNAKPTTHLSQFILHIAAIGDIVDGTDTTHDFNYFSLIYEWPKDLLTRLVFERGSTDAAGKVAEIMSADFVHEVVSACVPPVYPPRSGQGWACIPVTPTSPKTLSESKVLSPTSRDAKPNTYSRSSSVPGIPLYPLQLDIVKHLVKLSPVRAVLACVFGSSILYRGSDSTISKYLNDGLLQAQDDDRLFYEFALDQSERFPTLNRWIQMQTNLHRVAEFAVTSERETEESMVKSDIKTAIKRVRDPESDTESEIEDIAVGANMSTSLPDDNSSAFVAPDPWHDSPKPGVVDLDSRVFLSFDWENEGPYEKAVERLIEEGKLVDALAVSDRCLRSGASDHLLELLIRCGEENTLFSGQSQGFLGHSRWSNSWQYCLRLKDKKLAARLALKYMHRWELDAALDVIIMCSCHLPDGDPIKSEVVQVRQALLRYKHILSADDHYNSWQEVELECKEDPEGLALRLAGKGAVSAALEVAESAGLSIDLRRELQGRQLVKLLVADPLNGGGPAEASRFLSSLRDTDDALPVVMGAMQLLPNLRSKQLLVHFFLKRKDGNLSDSEISRLNSWALGLRVLAALPLPWQQRCSSLHEHPHLILEVLLMRKQLQSASQILKEFPSLRENSIIFKYAAKAIAVSAHSAARESRISVSSSRAKQKNRAGIPARSSFTSSLSNLQKEARRAFSWTPRNAGDKGAPKETYRKRKSSGLAPSERVAWEAMTGIDEDRVSSYPADGQDRLSSISIAEEWMLTGDLVKDDVVRASHRYESAPDNILFKALLSLCSDELVSGKGALDLCISQMKTVLSSQQVPENASMEIIGRAYHATEAFVQGLIFAKAQLRKIPGGSDLQSNEKIKDADEAASDAGSSGVDSQSTDELSEVLSLADVWLGRAELLQSLLGSGIAAALDDIADEESSGRLRDRLILDEKYSMAVYTCRKCKIDVFPVWNAWGHALIRMEHYAQARVKFKQALQLYKGDTAPVILEIINTIEGSPPVDVAAVRSMYEHLAKSAPAILDDSLSADSYLNVLYMPSTFPRKERYTRFLELASDDPLHNLEYEDEPRSNLDSIRYLECVNYFEEYARQHLLGFMFRHGYYKDACLLFFPPDAVPPSQETSSLGVATSSSPQRLDPLTTDYGTIDDLCDLCMGYGAMPVLEEVLSTRMSSISQDLRIKQHTVAALARICTYCESHKHFNYLYRFQVIKNDHVAAGLCCIQLFMNSSSQEIAVKHLENAKMHFDEGLSARFRTGDSTKLVTKGTRGKTASEKLTEEGLVKFSARVAIQVDIVKSFNETDGPLWKHSLFGNPNDPETFRRRCKIAETLVEKNFDLAFQVIYEFNLPAVDIYAGVAASLAERKKGGQLTEFFRNIKGTIDEDDWDQVLGAAINVYANKHKERPDRLIDMLTSSHRKVLACVVCGRLKSAFQIASRSGSVADVQYVAHQALHANALPVLDMCKQWLAQYM